MLSPKVDGMHCKAKVTVLGEDDAIKLMSPCVDVESWLVKAQVAWIPDGVLVVKRKRLALKITTIVQPSQLGSAVRCQYARTSDQYQRLLRIDGDRQTGRIACINAGATGADKIAVDAT